MPWVSRIAGQVTNLGYLYCVECSPLPTNERGEITAYHVVYADSHPCASEDCEGCDRMLSSVVGAELVHSSSREAPAPVAKIVDG